MKQHRRVRARLCRTRPAVTSRSVRTLQNVSTRSVTDEFAAQVTDDLRARYDLDDDDIRALGEKLAGDRQARTDENLAFAKRFTEEHRETFDRLAK